ncbi:hypothetical protein C4D60_Mb10t18460 [Musa balbisiana]|uniref:Uncharacterized protein n=1 Tax=Musa balbisiana TaxID=52838 RepID=A0A4S8IY31_MUSBA|nr:hypothetical protein C4D60_Mb10t18460 [Musa balbisiana]
MEKRKKNLQAPSLWSEGLKLTKSVDQAYRAAAKDLRTVLVPSMLPGAAAFSSGSPEGFSEGT